MPGGKENMGKMTRGNKKKWKICVQLKQIFFVDLAKKFKKKKWEDLLLKKVGQGKGKPLKPKLRRTYQYWFTQRKPMHIKPIGLICK